MPDIAHLINWLEHVLLFSFVFESRASLAGVPGCYSQLDLYLAGIAARSKHVFRKLEFQLEVMVRLDFYSARISFNDSLYRYEWPIF